ncbi:hypothetical protein LMG28727_05348 [Paraburkholderia kirstenboschensis]|nr:hypothetical protein LMG28727_05348 [Paraburkholderia kirstenboschensis]
MPTANSALRRPSRSNVRWPSPPICVTASNCCAPRVCRIAKRSRRRNCRRYPTNFGFASKQWRPTRRINPQQKARGVRSRVCRRTCGRVCGLQLRSSPERFVPGWCNSLAAGLEHRAITPQRSRPRVCRPGWVWPPITSNSTRATPSPISRPIPPSWPIPLPRFARTTASDCACRICVGQG